MTPSKQSHPKLLSSDALLEAHHEQNAVILENKPQPKRKVRARATLAKSPSKSKVVGAVMATPKDISSKTSAIAPYSAVSGEQAELLESRNTDSTNKIEALSDAAVMLKSNIKSEEAQLLGRSTDNALRYFVDTSAQNQVPLSADQEGAAHTLEFTRAADTRDIVEEQAPLADRALDSRGFNAKARMSLLVSRAQSVTNREYVVYPERYEQVPLLERSLSWVTLSPEELLVVQDPQRFLVVDCLLNNNSVTLVIERAVYLYTKLRQEQEQVKVYIWTGLSNKRHAYIQALQEHMAHLKLSDFTIGSQSNMAQALKDFDIVIVDDAHAVAQSDLCEFTEQPFQGWCTIFVDGMRLKSLVSARYEQKYEQLLEQAYLPRYTPLELQVLSYATARCQIEPLANENLVDDALQYLECYFSEPQINELIKNLQDKLEHRFAQEQRYSSAAMRDYNQQVARLLDPKQCSLVLEESYRNSLRWCLFPQGTLQERIEHKGHTLFSSHFDLSAPQAAMAYVSAWREANLGKQFNFLSAHFTSSLDESAYGDVKALTAEASHNKGSSRGFRALDNLELLQAMGLSRREHDQVNNMPDLVMFCALTRELKVPLFHSFALAYGSMQVYLNRRMGFTICPDQQCVYERSKDFRLYVSRFERLWYECYERLSTKCQERAQALMAVRLLSLNQHYAPLMLSALSKFTASWCKKHNISRQLPVDQEESQFQILDHKLRTTLLTLAHQDQSQNSQQLQELALSFTPLSSFDAGKLKALALMAHPSADPTLAAQSQELLQYFLKRGISVSELKGIIALERLTQSIFTEQVLLSTNIASSLVVDNSLSQADTLSASMRVKEELAATKTQQLLSKLSSTQESTNDIAQLLDVRLANIWQQANYVSLSAPVGALARPQARDYSCGSLALVRAYHNSLSSPKLLLESCALQGQYQIPYYAYAPLDALEHSMTRLMRHFHNYGHIFSEVDLPHELLASERLVAIAEHTLLLQDQAFAPSLGYQQNYLEPVPYNIPNLNDISSYGAVTAESVISSHALSPSSVWGNLGQELGAYHQTLLQQNSKACASELLPLDKVKVQKYLRSSEDFKEHFECSLVPTLASDKSDLLFTIDRAESKARGALGLSAYQIVSHLGEGQLNILSSYLDSSSASVGFYDYCQSQFYGESGYCVPFADRGVNNLELMMLSYRAKYQSHQPYSYQALPQIVGQSANACLESSAGSNYLGQLERSYGDIRVNLWHEPNSDAYATLDSYLSPLMAANEALPDRRDDYHIFISECHQHGKALLVPYSLARVDGHSALRTYQLRPLVKISSPVVSNTPSVAQEIADKLQQDQRFSHKRVALTVPEQFTVDHPSDFNWDYDLGVLELPDSATDLLWAEDDFILADLDFHSADFFNLPQERLELDDASLDFLSASAQSQQEHQRALDDDSYLASVTKLQEPTTPKEPDNSAHLAALTKNLEIALDQDESLMTQEVIPGYQDFDEHGQLRKHHLAQQQLFTQLHQLVAGGYGAIDVVKVPATESFLSALRSYLDYVPAYPIFSVALDDYDYLGNEQLLAAHQKLEVVLSAKGEHIAWTDFVLRHQGLPCKCVSGVASLESLVLRALNQEVRGALERSFFRRNYYALNYALLRSWQYSNSQDLLALSYEHLLSDAEQRAVDFLVALLSYQEEAPLTKHSSCAQAQVARQQAAVHQERNCLDSMSCQQLQAFNDDLLAKVANINLEMARGLEEVVSNEQRTVPFNYKLAPQGPSKSALKLNLGALEALGVTGKARYFLVRTLEVSAYLLKHHERLQIGLLDSSAALTLHERITMAALSTDFMPTVEEVLALLKSSHSRALELPSAALLLEALEQGYEVKHQQARLQVEQCLCAPSAYERSIKLISAAYLAQIDRSYDSLVARLLSSYVYLDELVALGLVPKLYEHDQSSSAHLANIASTNLEPLSMIDLFALAQGGQRKRHDNSFAARLQDLQQDDFKERAFSGKLEQIVAYVAASLTSSLESSYKNSPMSYFSRSRFVPKREELNLNTILGMHGLSATKVDLLIAPGYNPSVSELLDALGCAQEELLVLHSNSKLSMTLGSSSLQALQLRNELLRRLRPLK